jgi:hypothetical protein
MYVCIVFFDISVLLFVTVKAGVVLDTFLAEAQRMMRETMDTKKKTVTAEYAASEFLKADGTHFHRIQKRNAAVRAVAMITDWITSIKRSEASVKNIQLAINMVQIMRREKQRLVPNLGFTCGADGLALSTRVDQMEPGGSASEAGLLIGDDIQELDGIDTPNKVLLCREIAKKQSGQLVSIKIRRGLAVSVVQAMVGAAGKTLEEVCLSLSVSYLSVCCRVRCISECLFVCLFACLLVCCLFVCLVCLSNWLYRRYAFTIEVERTLRIASGTVFESDVGFISHDDSLSSFDVFLGGSCNPTTWRTDVAVPFLQKHTLSFFNPQVSQWTPDLMNIERKAKEQARVLLFVIGPETRGLGQMLEATEFISVCRRVVLVVQDFPLRDVNIKGQFLTAKEVEDLTRARAYLRKCAQQHGVPCFTSIEDALIEVRVVCLLRAA